MAQWIIVVFAGVGTVSTVLGMLFHWIRDTEHRSTQMEGRLDRHDDRITRLEKDTGDTGDWLGKRVTYLERLRPPSGPGSYE